MPELPEVEFARSCLERWLEGEKLARVEAEQAGYEETPFLVYGRGGEAWRTHER